MNAKDQTKIYTKILREINKGIRKKKPHKKNENKYKFLISKKKEKI